MAPWRFKRTLREDMLPLATPKLPDYLSPPENTSPEKFNEEMDAFEAEAERVALENEHRLERAMPWIKQCAMLHGMSYSFDLSGKVRPMTHRSWCPAPYWMNGSWDGDPIKWEWPNG